MVNAFRSKFTRAGSAWDYGLGGLRNPGQGYNSGDPDIANWTEWLQFLVDAKRSQ